MGAKVGGLTGGFQISAMIGMALAVAVTGSAVGHPHVFITNVTSFVFENRKVVAIRQAWEFDDVFSAVLLQDFDANADGEFDAKETAELRSQAFDALKDYNYFTFVRIGGKSVPSRSVQELRISNTLGRVTYSFTIPLDPPLDPAEQTIAVSVYDESYYIDISPDAADPVRLEGDYSPACQFRVGEDEGNPIYYGAVLPIANWLTCKPASWASLSPLGWRWDS